MFNTKLYTKWPLVSVLKMYDKSFTISKTFKINSSTNLVFFKKIQSQKNSHFPDNLLPRNLSENGFKIFLRAHCHLRVH